MAALAYVLLPLSGAIAYFVSDSRRVRFHGFQAILYGIVWPGALYAASAISSAVTAAVGIAGAAGWLLLIALAGVGMDPRFPGAKKLFERVEG